MGEWAFAVPLKGVGRAAGGWCNFGDRDFFTEMTWSRLLGLHIVSVLCVYTDICAVSHMYVGWAKAGAALP